MKKNDVQKFVVDIREVLKSKFLICGRHLKLLKFQWNIQFETVNQSFNSVSYHNKNHSNSLLKKLAYFQILIRMSSVLSLM